MSIEAYLAELSQRHNTFHDSSKEERIALAKSVLEALVKSDWDTVDNWVDEGVKTQKISSDDKEYDSLCSINVLLLGSILKDFLVTFIKCNEEEMPKLPTKEVGGNEVHGPFPIGPSVSGTVEIHANPSEYSTCDDTAAYDESCPKGTVSLVLGAGNQNFLTMMDAVDRVFLHNECVLIKHHPMRPYLIKPFQRILQPLIDDNIVRMVLDEGNEMTASLVKHPTVQHIHMTGSSVTYNIIKELVTASGKSSQCGITSELGCATPWIVVPGVWEEKELREAATLLVGSKKENGGCNCLAPQVLIVPSSGSDGSNTETDSSCFDTVSFCSFIEKELRSQETVPCYYPGSTARKKQFCSLYSSESVKSIVSDNHTINATAEDDISLIYLNSDDKNLYCIQNEVFGSLLVIVTMKCDMSDAKKYVDDVTNFVNSKIYGSLSCTLLSSKTTDVNLIDKMIADLHYGCIAVNTWTGLGYPSIAKGGVWGAHPFDKGHESGRGRVGNVRNLNGVMKTVLRSSLDTNKLGKGAPPAWILKIIITLAIKNAGLVDAVPKVFGIVFGTVITKLQNFLKSNSIYIVSISLLAWSIYASNTLKK